MGGSKGYKGKTNAEKEKQTQGARQRKKGDTVYKIELE
jgi:hypothetical protein